MKVSIVIPTYNRPDLLGRLLESIARQTYKYFEVIVIDDNSPNFDGYQQILNKYRDVFDEFTFLSNETNRGAPYSRNRGILIAKYDLIALVDDDDEWLPIKLKKQVELFDGNDAKLGIVYTWTDSVDDDAHILHRYRGEIEGVALEEILSECFIPSPSVMVSKTAILEAGLFDEDFPSCQDWDMWTRVIAKGYKCSVVKEVVTIYHKHCLESIGLSENALNGYRKYYKKHLSKTLSVSVLLFLKYLYKIIRL